MTPGPSTRSTCLVYTCLLLLSDAVNGFRHTWTANDIVKAEELQNRNGYQVFHGSKQHVDHFKLLLDEGNHILVGARNNVYNISLDTLKLDIDRKLEWKPAKIDAEQCISKVDENYRSKCQNFIQVLGKMNDGNLYVCGTNALKPECCIFAYKEDDRPVQIPEYECKHTEKGQGMAPYDPEHNFTAIFTDEKLYSGTVADWQARDPLIMVSQSKQITNGQVILRTKQHESNMLSNPNFVSTFDINDKIYFFLRENAVENINCGKTSFSRVARICKNDKGDQFNDRVWTSFFKARLNCSFPGDTPFPFDELQSTSDFNSGNYMPSRDNKNRTQMFYGVFNTPDNSIEGSAVCAFTYDDIEAAFQGKFKGQESAKSNWLSIPLDKTPTPHPASSCISDSKSLTNDALKFIFDHPLMDTAIGASGGAPVLMQTMAKGRFSAIAVDWQVYAADRAYYDVIFVGTTDGRVLKSVNKGHDGPIESSVIEDMQVLGLNEPVKEMKIYYRGGNAEKLIVISKENIKAIPLQRCSRHKTCGDCVALQDPYCAWKNNQCAAFPTGLQDIRHGDTSICPDGGKREEELPTPELPTTTKKPVTKACPACTCNCSQYNSDVSTNTSDKSNAGVPPPLPDSEDSGTDKMAHSRQEPCDTRYIPVRTDDQVYTASTLAIASVVSIVVAALVGFVIGYRVSMCRNHTRNTEQMINFEQNFGSLRKNPNRHSINEATHNYYADPNTQKQFNNKNNLTNNVIVAHNISQKSPNLPNGSVDTKTMSPKQASKTYL